MSVALHESLHSINPITIYSRPWLTEGWSRYNEYNLLENYGDINRETADTYLYQGTSAYNWQGYINNDYHDTTPSNNEIQYSQGYAITAWMFSMMRDNHNLDWASLYNTFENNEESLMKAFNLGIIDSDMVVIDVFSRASSIGNFEAAKPVWRYDGPSGPGWGVRQWELLDWYADLVVNLISFSKPNPRPGDSTRIGADIYNAGQTESNNVLVRIYSNDSLIHQQSVTVLPSLSTYVLYYYKATEGDYLIRVVVDEDNIKFETNDANNDKTRSLSFSPLCGDINGNGVINILDVTNLIGYLYKGGAAPACNAPYLGCADANGNGVINILDVTFIIGYLYKGGPAPDCP